MTTNPKDRIGVEKVSMTKIPATALLHCAMALMDGAKKYGAYNWREFPVQTDIYIDALKRHVDAWYDGEEIAADSGVHHLGHAMACCAILLDCQETGNLVDNRPKPGTFAKLLVRLNQQIKDRLTPSGDTGTQSPRESSSGDASCVRQAILQGDSPLS